MSKETNGNVEFRDNDKFPGKWWVESKGLLVGVINKVGTEYHATDSNEGASTYASLDDAKQHFVELFK